MKDYLVKSLAFDGKLRAYAVNATEIVRKAQKIHDTFSASSAAFGRTIIGSILLAASLMKGNEKMTVRIAGDGPVGRILVDADAKGNVKGYIQNPHVHLPLNEKHKIDVRRAVGKTGFLFVTKDLGLKEPFTGQVPLISGELGEDFAYYLAKSEQIPSAVGLSVFVNNDNTIGSAGGFLIQVMPRASDDILIMLEEKLKQIPMISEMMRNKKTPEDILIEIIGKENLKFLEKSPVNYQCDCSKKHFADLLKGLPKKDIKEMIEKDHKAEIICQFCGKKYQFNEEELQKIYDN